MFSTFILRIYSCLIDETEKWHPSMEDFTINSVSGRSVAINLYSHRLTQLDSNARAYVFTPRRKCDT